MLVKHRRTGRRVSGRVGACWKNREWINSIVDKYRAGWMHHGVLSGEYKTSCYFGGKKTNETWSKIVIFASSPANTFPFCRTHDMFLERFVVVVTGGGVGLVHHSFFCLTQGHNFSVQMTAF